jgi:hypothetical protein
MFQKVVAEEFDVSHIFAMCIKSFLGRRGTYLLFMTHISDDDIPPVSHRLNEVHRTVALQYAYRSTISSRCVLYMYA